MKIRLLAVALLAPLAGVSPASDSAAAKPKVAADIALELLLAGNKRFVAGRPMFPDQSPAHRRELAGGGQKPFAIVLTCADSRVAPELYFDQGLGNLYVLRNAGPVLNDHVVGAVEYAVEQLHAGLLLVVGHDKCGAVAAAVAGGSAPGRRQAIVEAIQPAVRAGAGLTGDKVDHAVRAHARLVAAALQGSDPVLRAAVQQGRLKIVAARYDLATGRVELLEGATEKPAALAQAAH